MHYGTMLFPNIHGIILNHNVYYTRIKAAIDMQQWKQSCGWESQLGTFIITNEILWPAQFLYSEISLYITT